MSYKPVGLESTLDPWAEQEHQTWRVSVVTRWLMDLMSSAFPPKAARKVHDNPPAFVAEVPHQGIAVTWVVLNDALPDPMIVIEELLDMDTGRRWTSYWLGDTF